MSQRPRTFKMFSAFGTKQTSHAKGIIIRNNAFHCDVDRRTPIFPMPSVSYNPFFPVWFEARPTTPRRDFSAW
ncbi:hypothetical protein F0L16_21250 [Photorhabdus heterorhabditis]|uniref:Uncharacterized protein n=1 Tax=Photorhabdus heterorhabditis TaxID=880156 RepID=A0A5B0VHA5_9GAMM|nr:hypothetical protein F0L16_21250 [Photorhabdus heterorhabditis]